MIVSSLAPAPTPGLTSGVQLSLFCSLVRSSTESTSTCMPITPPTTI